MSALAERVTAADRLPRLSCAFALCLQLAGCAIPHVSPEDLGALVPDRSTQVVVGEAQRADVQRVLGEPLLSSTFWRFDLFRTSATQQQVVFAVTPWPIPFARFEDEVQRFTLVAYDTQARAGAVSTGLFRKPAAWRNMTPIAPDFRALHLRAADLMFFVDPEGAREANILVAPRQRDTFLADPRASKRCTVVLGCGARGCGDQLSIDAAPARRLPLRTAHVYWIPVAERAPWLQDTEPHGSDPAQPWLEALVALELDAGEHTLVFSARHLEGSASAQLACRAGEVTWLTIDATSDRGFWRQSLIDWSITQDATMPAMFARRPLVLLDDGQWYVAAEPATPR